jgi:DNA-binding XRE family transcriptional regulator
LPANEWRKFKMKTKRTTRYRFSIEKESPRFKKIYFDELDRLNLARRIAELREKNGLTQAELARKVGTTQAGISRLENPNYRNYSLKTLAMVATALGARLRVDLEEGRKAA